MRVDIVYKVTGAKSGTMIAGPIHKIVDTASVSVAEEAVFRMCRRRWPGHDYHVHVEPAFDEAHCSVGAEEIATALRDEPTQHVDRYA